MRMGGSARPVGALTLDSLLLFNDSPVRLSSPLNAPLSIVVMSEMGRRW